MTVYITHPKIKHRTQFIQATKNSKKLHAKWANPPIDAKGFKENVLDEDEENNPLFLIFNKEDDSLVGCVNINGTHFYNFCSAYLGYYAFERNAGKGLMKQGIVKVISYCFKELKLHRLEANIQPENIKSINLVKSLGFTKEGYSRRYLKIRGKWRDHERWAIIKEDWKPSKL